MLCWYKTTNDMLMMPKSDARAWKLIYKYILGLSGCKTNILLNPTCLCMHPQDKIYQGIVKCIGNTFSIYGQGMLTFAMNDLTSMVSVPRARHHSLRDMIGDDVLLKTRSTHFTTKPGSFTTPPVGQCIVHRGQDFP